MVNCAMVITSGSVIATAVLHWRSLVTLFAAPDVVLIYFISATPLALLAVLRLQRSLAALAALLILTTGAVLALIGAINAGFAVSSTFIANLPRTLVACSIVLSIAILARIVFRPTRLASATRDIASFPSECDGDGVDMAVLIEHSHGLPEADKTVAPDSRLENGDCPASAGSHPIAVLGFGVLVLVLLPTVYIAARCQHEITELINLIEQSRIAEARQLCQVLTALSPSADIRGRPLKKLAHEIDRDLGALTSRLAAIGPDPELPEQQLERCRLLAILGRGDEALVELIPLRQTPVSPAAHDLCGTIHETTAHWTMARVCHLRAKADWIRQPESSDRTAGVFRATTRIAYCHRKLGAYELAEEAYREALMQSPTAETHFLLAQFYEDMQQARKAMDHARQAMKLAPQRYQHAGRTLIDKLTVGHFGCLTIHFAEVSTSQRLKGLLGTDRER